MKTSNTAKRLREIMNTRGLRQIDILRLARPFCEKLGVVLGSNDLSQYVAGKVEPGGPKLSVLGMALNVDEVWLMGYDVPMERRKAAQSTSVQTAPKTTFEEQVECFVREIMSAAPENFKRRLLITLSQLDETDWGALERIICNVGNVIRTGSQDAEYHA